MAGSTTFNQGMSIAVARAFLGEIPLGRQAVNFAIDWSAGNCQCVTLAASGLTITAPTVGVGFFQLKITQDSVGSRTLPTFVPAINWIGGAPVLPIAPGSIDLIQLYCDGANFFGTSLAASNPTELPTLIVGDPGTEAGGITVGGVTYQSVLKVSDIGGTNVAQMILHRHSTTLESILVGSRSNSNTAAHAAVTAGQNSLSLFAVGYTGTDYEIQGEISIGADLTGVISATSSPGRMVFSVTPTGTVVPVPWLTVTNDGKAAFANQILQADGSAAFPSFGFFSNPNYGIYFIPGTGIGISTGGFCMAATANKIVLKDSYSINFSTDGTPTGILGSGIFADAPNILAIKSTTNPQIFRVYKTSVGPAWIGFDTVDAASPILKSTFAMQNNAAAQVATITNSPTAGNPTKWIPINDNGTIRNIPAW
jgi:hypothetical protein